MDKLKLTYFDFSGGRAEPARLALHIGGIPFDDNRFAFGDFAEVRKTTPLDQVPTLHVNDVQVTQSDAITRYAGKRAGLYPEDDLQALFCDEVMGALEDINTKIGATFGMTGDALKHARETLAADVLPRYLRWLQNQLEAHGGEFFADHRLTVADLVGHCDTSFLERTYCHPRLDKKRSAAEAFAAVQFGESIRSRP